MEEQRYDVVIVGGGPAGLTAGLFCGRSALRTLLLEKGALGGQLLVSEQVDNYPGIRNMPGLELAGRIEEHARDSGANIQQAAVAEVFAKGREIIVLTEDGRVFRAGAVIVCTGGSPKKLSVAGEAEFTGRGVSYCAVCDGPFFRDKVIAVVGSGDSAVGEGDYLTRFAREVILVSNKDRLNALPVLQKQLLANPKVEVIWNAAVQEIGGRQTVEWMRYIDLRERREIRLAVSGVFVYIGFRPNSQIFRDGVALDRWGYVVTSWDMETSISGIFAAGDIRSQSPRQITNAVGDATTAAISAYRYLQRHGLLERPEPRLLRAIADGAGRPGWIEKKAG